MIDLYQNSTGTKICAFLLLLALIVVKLFSGDFTHETDVKLELASLPYEFAEWQGADSVGLDDKSKLILQLDDYVKRVYKNKEGDAVYLYIGYWKKQNGEHQAAKHSPVLCLPANGWELGQRNLTSFLVENLTIPVKKVFANLKDKEFLFHYYFFAGDAFYAQEWKALLNISTQTMTGGRSDGGIVEAYTLLKAGDGKKSKGDKADEVLSKFLKDLTPYLNKKIKSSQAS